jgi:hypothetical protein
MGRKPSLAVGDTVNDFLVVALLPQGKAGKHRRYRVMCPRCKQEVTMTSQTILNSKSCGCTKKDSSTWKRKGAINRPWKLPEGEASFNYLYYQYQCSAKKRNIFFELTREEFKAIITKPCSYCGDCCQSVRLSKGANGGFNYTGIDRRNNNEGYTLNNSIACCKTCNFMKLDHDYDFFLSHLQKILTYRSNEERKSLDD